MKLYLLVSVYQNGKQIVKSSATSIEPPGLLSDLLKITLSINDIPNANISVDFQREKSNDWHIVSKGIQRRFGNIKYLKGSALRFTWNDENNNTNISQIENHKNAFNILMNNATDIHLPPAQGSNTRNKLLYNHIIELLRI
ncbi:8483_t:CDS:1 [Funneliformis caledonium]|uniref:8483_t:CDS:1 n=1 Tax=Funneliformis caledonium TaxID=1117310 RepID=A0A9N8VLS9_9GLOM|nr:8483_t:CDS:1 [Funneliformis caledonium]